MPSHLHCTPCCCVPCGNLMSLAGRVKNSFLCSCLCGWLAIRRCSKCWHCETASVICWAAQRGLTNEFIWNWLIMSTLYLGEEVLWRCRSWFVTRFMGCGLPHACHFLAFTEMLRCRSASNTPTLLYNYLLSLNKNVIMTSANCSARIQNALFCELWNHCVDSLSL